MNTHVFNKKVSLSKISNKIAPSAQMSSLLRLTLFVKKLFSGKSCSAKGIPLLDFEKQTSFYLFLKNFVKHDKQQCEGNCAHRILNKCVSTLACLIFVCLFTYFLLSFWKLCLATDQNSACPDLLLASRRARTQRSKNKERCKTEKNSVKEIFLHVEIRHTSSNNKHNHNRIIFETMVHINGVATVDLMIRGRLEILVYWPVKFVQEKSLFLSFALSVLVRFE